MSERITDVRTWLNVWCRKRQIEENYHTTSIGHKRSHRHKYICELHVDTLAYVGAGESTNRRGAETNAAKDFIIHYCKEGIIKPHECESLQFQEPTTRVKVKQPQSSPYFQNNPYEPDHGFQDGGNPYPPFQRDMRPMPLMNSGGQFSPYDNSQFFPTPNLPLLGHGPQFPNIDQGPNFTNLGQRPNFPIVGQGSKPSLLGQRPNFPNLGQGSNLSLLNQGNQQSLLGPVPDQSLWSLVPALQATLNVQKPNQNQGEWRSGASMDINSEIAASKKAEVDVDDGGWTIDVAKSRLSCFLIVNNIHENYEISVSGDERNKFFIAEMTFYLDEIKREIHGEGTGINKQAARKDCALNIVTQLYHLELLEAHGKKKLKEGRERKERRNIVTSYEVAISPELESQIDQILKFFNIHPTPVVENGPSQSLIIDKKLDENSTKKIHAVVIPWSSPKAKWDPWMSCNIDEGPYAERSMDEISKEMQSSLQAQLQSDTILQKRMQERFQLPIISKKQEILNAIIENPVVIISGDTGSGKSTQVCQYILDDYIQLGYGAFCNIISTQSRRISALTISDRVAYERGEGIGQTVGYAVKFKSLFPRPCGGILFCGADVLLRKLEAGLHGVSHIIVDEVHERDVFTDFLLIILRDMVEKFPELRVILITASVDISKFTNYFSNPTVVEVSGNPFPVDEYFLEDFIEASHYLPYRSAANLKRRKEKEKEEIPSDPELNMNIMNDVTYSRNTIKSMQLIYEHDKNFEVIEAMLNYISTLNMEGSILIFLPGWYLVSGLMEFLEQHAVFGGPLYMILPLHAQQTLEQQRRVFEPTIGEVRKIIVATNIAESSITLNDVAFVIDSCRAKVRRSVTSYTNEWASKASLEERKGRAGRTRQGMCFRMCSKRRYDKLNEVLAPEITLTPLPEIGLLIKLLRLGSVSEFLSKAISVPPSSAIEEAEVTLRELNCLDANDEMTPLGQILARLPLEPHLGSMIIMSCILNCGDAMCTIAAYIATFPEIFIVLRGYNGLSPFQQAFAGCRYSDHLTMLNVFQSWEEARKEGEEAEVDYCDYNMVSMQSLRGIWEAKNHLKEELLSNGFAKECLMPSSYNFTGPDKNLDIIAALLTVGHYPNVCFAASKGKPKTKDERAIVIDKASVTFSRDDRNVPIPYFVFGEQIGYYALKCRQLSMVTPIHLLLMGCQEVEYVDGLLLVDKWLKLKIDPHVASKIVALRPVLEALVVRFIKEPETLPLSEGFDKMVADFFSDLFNINAGRYNMKPIAQSEAERISNKSPSPPRQMREDSPPNKMRRSDQERFYDDSYYVERSGTYDDVQYNNRSDFYEARGYERRDQGYNNHPFKERASTSSRIRTIGGGFQIAAPPPPPPPPPPLPPADHDDDDNDKEQTAMPWWTPACAEAVRARKIASRRYQRTGLRADYSAYKEQCNATRRVLRLARNAGASTFSNTQQ